MCADMAPVSFLETGVLYRADNLHRLREFPADCIDLIYLDPPFFSNRRYEVIWGDEAEVRSFEDRWEGGIRHYVEWMRERVMEMHRVLKPTGSLYLHCDPNASHYLKVMLDEIFLPANFRNEVVWQRTGVKGDARRKFGAVHDVLLVYGKADGTYFEVPRREPDEAYLARFDLDDRDGRGPHHSAPLDSPSPRPNLTYPYKGYDPPAKGWRVDLTEMERLDAEGRLIFPRKAEGRIRRKLFLSEAPGPPVGDVWTDIQPVSRGAEQLGYPTQKPEALLERILEASTTKGQIVLDPFCGCGTTIAVAQRLQREWIGIDISPQAVAIMKRRVDKYGANARVEGLPATLDDLRALGPFEFQNWVIGRVHGVGSARKSGDMGVDGWSFFERLPIQVKQSDRVGRNVVDNFETAIERSGNDTGYLVAYSFGKGAYEEAARSKKAGKAAVILVKVSDLLKVAELIEDAEVEKRAPDLSKATPDLMRLFSGRSEPKEPSIPGEFPMPESPGGAAKPSPRELIESARRKQPSKS